MAALTTLFTPASWCSDRFAVFVDDHAPGTSIIPPSSGWVDPSFTKCIPMQYTTAYPTFSPGVCPVHMQIVKHTFDIHDEPGIDHVSGFSPMSIDPQYMCTSTITSPMPFLLDPEISTADVYTTLAPELWIEHDQVTVQWEPSDLKLFPVGVASQYKLMMGITAQPSTDNAVSPTAESVMATTPPTSTPVPAPAPALTTTSVLWPTTTTSQTSTSSISTSETQSQVTPTNNGRLHDISGSVILAVILFAVATFFVS
ncbi:hypothetical protein F4823DRAFT_631951 [Ustulina deusta]|nr:hypothetical protein F4823DRAFT_631951 [Ustulina deusta]